MALKIIWNDICREKTDVIVTPASRFARVGTGLDKIIHKVAGEQLLEARRLLGSIGPGTVKVTDSFGLKKATGAKWVIHALGPIWDEDSGIKEALILEGCYFRILCKAVELKCKTVSVPVMSSGKFGMPMPKAVDIAVRAILEFLKAFPSLTVKLVGIDPDFFDYAQKSYRAFCVKSDFTKEEVEALRKKFGQRAYDAQKDQSDDVTLEEEDPYFKKYMFDRETRGRSFKELFQHLWADLVVREKRAKRDRLAMRKRGSPMRRYMTTNSDLSYETGISLKTIRNYCSKAGGSVKTSRDKIFALAVAMRLSTDYARALLATCGYKFNESSLRDEIIYNAIEARKGSVYDLDSALENVGLATLKVCNESSHEE